MIIVLKKSAPDNLDIVLELKTIQDTWTEEVLVQDLSAYWTISQMITLWLLMRVM